MAERADLEAAAEAGVIAREQVDPLVAFLAARAAPATVESGEENLRFIRNFHDVFLAMGIVLFAVGMAVAIGAMVSGIPTPRLSAFTAGGLAAGAAGVMWVLGELFARRRRLFLPAIAIVVSLTLFAAFATGAFYVSALAGQITTVDALWDNATDAARMGALVTIGAGILAPLAFYLRFRLPFSMGMIGAASAAFVIVAVLLWGLERAWTLPVLNLALGALLFAAGVWFDARDPGRQTRYSDNGFWLHFAAAPLILNGAFGLTGLVLGDGSGNVVESMARAEGAASTVQAAVTLVVVVLLGLVSLLINRRALIVSALLTAGVAIGVLMNAVGLEAGGLAASTLIVLGGFVLILGAGWHGARRALLGWVKPDGAWARIFPPESVIE